MYMFYCVVHFWNNRVSVESMVGFIDIGSMFQSTLQCARFYICRLYNRNKLYLHNDSPDGKSV